MKITTEKLTIWAKRAIPALALAATAGVMLPGCDKDPIEQKTIYRAPYEKELFFRDGNEDSITVSVVQKYADDTACKKIYLTTKPYCDLTDGADFVNKYRAIILQPVLNVSPKVTGRGDIYISKRPDAIYKEDSIWYVQNGWNVRQR